jgi:BMFP domain-containing protein YqiC
MATPSRGNVQGVSVAGGISVQGDFTYGSVASVTQPGFKEVNLKCGKGFPLIQLPRIQWTKPPRENVIFPSLNDLIKDIQDAFSTVHTDIVKAVDTAKANIDASWYKNIGSMKDRTGPLGDIANAISGLFYDEVSLDLYRYFTVIDYSGAHAKKEFVETVKGNGAFGFKIKAEVRGREIFFEKVGDEWWKYVLTPVAILATAEWWKTAIEWRREIEERFSSAIGVSMTLFRNGFENLLKNIPTVMKDIATQIGTVVNAVITSITNALYTVAQELSDYAKKVVQASIGMVKNAVYDLLEKTINTLNDILVKIETGYNTIIQKFNTAVVEPIQCKLKEIEDKLKQIDWVFGIKFPSFPRLPGVGNGGGAYSLPQWFSALSTTLVQIDNKISNLSTRVAILENKVSAMK